MNFDYDYTSLFTISGGSNCKFSEKKDGNDDCYKNGCCSLYSATTNLMVGEYYYDSSNAFKTSNYIVYKAGSNTAYVNFRLKVNTQDASPLGTYYIKCHLENGLPV